VNFWVAVREGSDDVLREPCSFPCDFERDIEDEGVLVFRAYAGEVFRCETTVDVLTNVISCEVVRLNLVYMIYCFA